MEQKYIYLAQLALLIYVFGTGCNSNKSSTHTKKIVLCMGQSNALGAGQDEDYPPFPNVTLVNASINPSVQYRGPCIAFAEEFAKHNPNIQVVVRQYAVGGSPMEYWTRPIASFSSELNYFKRDQLLAVLFWQGETDGEFNFDSLWSKRFIMLVNVLRHDFGLPNLPVIYAQIGSQGLPDNQAPGWTRVQQDQASVNMPNVVMVRTTDVPRNSPLHFSAKSYWEVGRRMAQAYFALGDTLKRIDK